MKKITGIILTLLISCMTYVSAQVTLSGATGSINGSYTNLIAAFAAINGNGSGLATDNLILELSASTTETAATTSTTTTLNAPRGISATVVTPGATTYKFPEITLTGGTRTGIPGTFIVTINNGKVLTIANSSGTWTVAPTISIEGASGTNSLNVSTQATAICVAPSTGGNLTTYVTNGGAGYGPKTTVTATSGGSDAAISYGLISTATTPTGTGPLTIQPAAIAVSTNSYVDNAGSGYTAGTAGATAPAENTTGGTFASGSAATASSVITIPNANYASVKIYPTVTGVVINSSTAGNQPFIVLNGAKNVTIDGRVHTAGVPSGGADLTIQHKTTSNTGGTAASTNNASTIYLNAGAHHNTITYCKIKSMTQNGNTRGTLAIGTNSLVNGASASSVGGSYNTISYNEFSPLNPSGFTYVTSGNGGMLTFANCNDDFPSTNNIIDNNTFDNYFIAGPTGNISAAIYVYGNPNPNKPNHSNYTITNNSFFNSVDGATTANASRMFIKVGNAPYLYGGYGHMISGNYIGGKAAGCTGGTLTKTGAFADNMTGILLNASYGAATTIQNNVIKNISMTNGTGAVSNTTKFIDVNGYGAVSVTGNTIGDNASPIVIDNSTMTLPSNLYGIYINAIGNVTCENNTIANITHNTVTGNLYGINHETGANTFNANANLIHSLNVTATSTAAKVVGIYCASGTNSITNNIVKLNGDNVATIYGLDEEETAATTSFYHNTVYLSGAPTTGALNSACIASNGTTNTRNIQNNIFVNARTNNGATGTHYALYMPNTGGTIAVNANDYQATGASGAMLGNYGGADVSSGSIIVTGQDANSQNVDPGFASVGGTLAADYMTSTTLTGVSSTVTTDFSGATRAAIQMGAWNKSIGTSVDNSVKNDGITVTRKNNQFIIICANELKSDASVSVYNVIGRKLVSTPLINTTTILDKTFQSGIYLVSVMNGGKATTKKMVLN